MLKQLTNKIYHISKNEIQAFREKISIFFVAILSLLFPLPFIFHRLPHPSGLDDDINGTDFIQVHKQLFSK